MRFSVDRLALAFVLPLVTGCQLLLEGSTPIAEPGAPTTYASPAPPGASAAPAPRLPTHADGGSPAQTDGGSPAAPTGTLAQSPGPDAAPLGPPPTLTSSYRDEVLADAPVAYYRFEELSLDRAVDERAMHTGTYRGGSALGAPGVGGSRALALDGFRGGLDVPSIDFSGRMPFSVECWVRPDASAPTAWEQLFQKDDNSPSGRQQIGAYLSGSNLIFERWVDGFAVIATAPLQRLGYSHLVMVYDGDELRLYTNGALVRSSGDARSQPPKSRPWTLGYDLAGESYLAGVLDEVAIYNFALGAARIRDHYERGR